MILKNNQFTQKAVLFQSSYPFCNHLAPALSTSCSVSITSAPCFVLNTFLTWTSAPSAPACLGNPDSN